MLRLKMIVGEREQLLQSIPLIAAHNSLPRPVESTTGWLWWLLDACNLLGGMPRAIFEKYRPWYPSFFLSFFFFCSFFFTMTNYLKMKIKAIKGAWVPPKKALLRSRAWLYFYVVWTTTLAIGSPIELLSIYFECIGGFTAHVHCTMRMSVGNLKWSRPPGSQLVWK